MLQHTANLYHTMFSFESLRLALHLQGRNVMKLEVTMVEVRIGEVKNIIEPSIWSFKEGRISVGRPKKRWQ